MTLNTKEVTLYQSGVGFFTADCPEKKFILPVNEKDINDVLKSLSVNGLNSVRFNSSEELDRVINKIGIDLETDGALLSVCNHLIGLEVKVTTNETINGIVMGVDDIDDDSESEYEKISNEVLVLKIADEIRNFAFKDIKDIEILDPIVEKDLQTYLNFISNSRKAGVVNLLVEAKENTWATWVMPVSSWRLSYRLFFTKSEKELDLFGISIIDNTTSIDWEKVVLRLVTGKPVSFQYDLFNPLFIYRPEIARDIKGVAPIISEVGGRFDDFEEEADDGLVEMDVMTGAAAPPPPPSAAPRRAEKMLMAPRAKPGAPPKTTEIKPTIEAIEEVIGSAIAYVVKYPVTINRSQSALIPIFNDKLKGELCVVLRDDRINQPMDALQLTKPIDVEKGATTIYIDGQYAGESMIIPGTEFIAFRLNQEINTMRELETQRKIESISVEGLYLHFVNSTIQEQTFKFINKGKELIPLILEITRNKNYQPLTKPDAITNDYFRYNFDLKPGNSIKKFIFKEITDQFISITNLNENQLENYLKNETISHTDRKKIEEIKELYLKLKKKEVELKEIDKEIEHLFTNQSRIRANIIVIKDDQNLKEEYLQKLRDSEKQIENQKEKSSQLKKEIENLAEKFEALQ
ncbi:MAG: hypothetical protein EAX90_08545 [Candidatus Heimdallarchaeota archaeon]|nr:hypothetical protein [Candidatus Heimdallarchaeota archaeon]